jgi:hypothetical protein
MAARGRAVEVALVESLAGSGMALYDSATSTARQTEGLRAVQHGQH